MRVTATLKGFFGKVREVGEVFDVPAGTESTWFGPAPAEPKRKATHKAKRKVPRKKGV